MIKINYSYTILFAATVAGVGTDADSTPTAVLWRNGSASGVSVTVNTTAQTGLYKAVFTTDAGWAAADFLELYVTATIAGTAGYLAKVWSSTEIGAVELDSGRSQTLSDLGAMITGSGTADAKFDAVALSNAPSGSSLTGPYTRTILITDADTDEGIEVAQVRVYRPGESESKQTVDGNEVEFTLAAATWTYAVTANGYQGRSGSLVVTGDGETTIELTPLSITPGDVGQTTGWLITRVRGAATADITIRYQQIQEPDDDTGSSYDSTIYQAVSDSEGLAELTLIPGCRYYIWRGLIKKPESTPIITIPANAGSTYELPSHVGK